MKENVSGMETNMDQLLETVTAVRGKSDGINSSLFERRGRIEELNGTRSLLRKVQVFACCDSNVLSLCCFPACNVSSQF